MAIPVVPSTSRFHVAVIGGGPAGLMAAEVLARGGAQRHRLRPHAFGRPQVPAGRPRRPQSHPQRRPRAPARPLRRGRTAPAACDRGVSARRAARLVRGSRPADLRRVQRPGVSESHEGVAAAAGLARRVSTATGVAFELRHRWLRLGRRRPAPVRRRPRAASRCGRTPPSWRWAAPAGRGSGPMAAGSHALAKAGIAVAPLRPANCGFLVPWSDVFRSRFEGQPLKRLELSFGGRTVRGEALVTAGGPGGRRRLCAVRAAARRHRRGGRGRCCTSTCAPTAARADLERASRRRRGKQSLATFLRKAAHLSPVAIGLLREAAMSSPQQLSGSRPTALAALIKAVPVRLIGVGAHRPRHLHRRRRRLRRGRRALHAAPPARRVRRRRDAGLGGADRRLSAAGRPSRPAPRPAAARCNGLLTENRSTRPTYSRRTLVTSLPAARMRAMASRIGSIATAMWKALAWTSVAWSRTMATWPFQNNSRRGAGRRGRDGASGVPSACSCMSLSRGQGTPQAASATCTSAGAVEAEAGLAAPQIGRAEETLGHRDEIASPWRRSARDAARARSRRTR